MKKCNRLTLSEFLTSLVNDNQFIEIIEEGVGFVCECPKSELLFNDVSNYINQNVIAVFGEQSSSDENSRNKGRLVIFVEAL